MDGFAAWPLCTFVERHGAQHPTESLEAMESLTRAWSCEFAIRPFLDQHLDQTMAAVWRWVKEGTVDGRMISHALRSLVKQGHPGALAVLGCTTDAEVDVLAFDAAPAAFRLGNYVELHAVLKSTHDAVQRLAVDFVIHLRTARGSASVKVFNGQRSILSREPNGS